METTKSKILTKNWGEVLAYNSCFSTIVDYVGIKEALQFQGLNTKMYAKACFFYVDISIKKRSKTVNLTKNDWKETVTLLKKELERERKDSLSTEMITLRGNEIDSQYEGMAGRLSAVLDLVKMCKELKSIGDEGIEALANNWPESLGCLSMCGNAISDEGALAENPPKNLQSILNEKPRHQ